MPWTGTGGHAGGEGSCPPAEQPGADEPLPGSGRTSRCVSFRKGLLKHPITLSLLPVSPAFDAFWHCMKQLCPAARISMDTCFNGDASLAQLRPRSPIYPLASAAALPTPQPACLRASSKAPAAGHELGSWHGWGPSLHPFTHAGAQPMIQANGVGDLPVPSTPMAIPQHPLMKGRGWEATTPLPAP